MDKIEIVNCPGCGNPTIKYSNTEYCGKCIDKYTYGKERYNRNREHYRELGREYYGRNRECILNYCKNKTDCRNNNLDPDSNHGIGYITEVLVSKFLEIKTCFDMTGNFCYPGYDLLRNEDWGLINAKESKLYNENGYECHRFYINKNEEPDFFFCIGYDQDRTHVLSAHYIPNDYYISKLTALSVPMRGYSKYSWFEEDPKPWDDLFHTLKLEKCVVLRPMR